MNISDVKNGFWGISRITQEADGGYKTAASVQELAERIESYYPPFNIGVGFPVEWALVRLSGAIGNPNNDTLLISVEITDVATIGDLAPPVRSVLLNRLDNFLSYNFSARGQSYIKPAFDTTGYSNATQLKQVIADVFNYFHHSVNR